MEKGRFLFVDDEIRILEGIENLLFDAPEGWECSFVLGGEEALEELAKGPYDVLITDMRMPGMDGTELLDRARELYPAMARVVLSGHVAAAAAQHAMAAVHEFLSKPCSAEVLLDTMTRCIGLANQSHVHSFHRAVGAIESLPSRPEIHSKATALLDGGGSLRDVAKLVSTDIAISAKLLHVASTAFYSRGRQVASVDEAVSRLGSATTNAIIMAVETYEALPKPAWFDVDALHCHSTAVGTLASQLCTTDRPCALLAGMLHDVGQLLMGVHFPEERQQSVALQKSTGMSAGQAELAVMGFDHAALGAHLIRLWNISDPLADAVGEHHRTGLIGRGPVSLAVFAADYALRCPEASDDSRLTAEELDAVERGRASLRDCAA